MSFTLHHSLIRDVVKKPGKVLCCMFLLALLVLTPRYKIGQNTKCGYVCSYNLPIEAL